MFYLRHVALTYVVKAEKLDAFEVIPTISEGYIFHELSKLEFSSVFLL